MTKVIRVRATAVHRGDREKGCREVAWEDHRLIGARPI